MWFKMIWWIEAQIVHEVVSIGQISVSNFK